MARKTNPHAGLLKSLGSLKSLSENLTKTMTDTIKDTVDKLGSDKEKKEFLDTVNNLKMKQRIDHAVSTITDINASKKANKK